ncbi:hypothetical protein DID78_03330 [Candidatus Marinamargulisbacteria bacterium SCGC AG-343-D04]|nr:hypothetical protein DID78_03330 [Candidatus Marinamargulisbacteria bacterium SCGC AG-343-D04]
MTLFSFRLFKSPKKYNLKSSVQKVKRIPLDIKSEKIKQRKLYPEERETYSTTGAVLSAFKYKNSPEFNRQLNTKFETFHTKHEDSIKSW